MNSVFRKLVEHELLNQLSAMQLLKGTLTRRVLMTIAYGIVVVMMIVYAGLYAYGLCTLGLIDAIFPLMSMAVMMLTLLLTLFQAGHLLYEPKDMELLMSLPIPLKSVLCAKLSVSVLMSMFVAWMMLVSSAVVISYFTGDVLLIVWSILLSPVIVIIPCSISVLLSAFVVMISSRFQAKTLLSVVLLVGILFGLPSLINSFATTEKIIQVTESLNASLMLNPLVMLVSAALNGNLFSIGLLSFGSIVVAEIVLWVISKNYVRVRSQLFANTKTKFTYTEQRSSGLLKAMIEREFRHYFSSSIYVMNTIVGLVMGIAVPIALCFMSVEEMLVLMELPIEVSQIQCILPLIFGMICSMCSTTSSSLSLEGKQIHLLKSLPIDLKEIYFSKICMNLILCLPVSLVGSVMMMLNLKGTILESCFMLIAPLCLLVFSSVTGMLMNAFFQNYNWVNEAEIVKQSFPTFVGMFLPMIIGIACIFIIILFEHVGVLYLICGLFLMVSFVEWQILKNRPIES